jgi:cytochrome c-type biogenesis protein
MDLAFAFTAGMLATVNPCGWAMLPSFVSYYLGTREAGYENRPPTSRTLEGLYLGLLVTAGFLTIFGTAGIVISAGLRFFVNYIPLAGLVIGVILLSIGLLRLAGKNLPLTLPVLQMDIQARNPKSVYLFGIAYASASLSCTLPIFLAVVGASVAAADYVAGATMFGAYAMGMGTVLTAVTLGAALLKGMVAQWFRRFLPYVHRLGAALLVIAGLYLIWRQWQSLPFILKGLGIG